MFNSGANTRYLHSGEAGAERACCLLRKEMQMIKLRMFAVFALAGLLVAIAPARSMQICPLDGYDAAQKQSNAPLLSGFIVDSLSKRKAPAMSLRFASSAREIGFSGQCSADSHCGVGWKCCGTCCKNVTTCG